MEYISTRGATGFDIKSVMLSGLAPDGGLFLPATWPHFDADTQAELASLPYPKLAARVALPFVGDVFEQADLEALYAKAYADFGGDDALALFDGANDVQLLELFHGPTLAFKDYALKPLGLMLDHVSTQPLLLVGATSGDTGAAAIEAVRALKQVKLVMLHPYGRVSDVQRKQMTTVDSANILNVAIDGNFDDCQALVKHLLADQGLRAHGQLSSVNSINWLRILGQVVYYAYVALRLGTADKPVHFSVPTGNFGDVYAGYLARRMGFAVGRLIVATNDNDILVRTCDTGLYSRRAALATLAPAMDISVASNFERLLYDLMDQDADAVRALMLGFAETGEMRLSDKAHQALKAAFDAAHVDEAEMLATMAGWQQQVGYHLDPHSAIGVAAAHNVRDKMDGPMVALATAHVGKFDAAAGKAYGAIPPRPAALEACLQREEKFTRQTAEYDTLKALIESWL